MGDYTKVDLFNTLAEYADVKIFWKDKERRFLGASKSFLDFYGIGLDDILGKTDEDLGWHINPEPYQNVEYQVIQTGVPIYASKGKCIIRGNVRHIIATKMPVHNEDGDIVGLVGYFWDVTDRQSDMDKIMTKVNTDELTGLANQRALSEATAEYIEEYYKRGVDFAVIVLDINNFREFNDTYGRESGDKYLQMVADDLVQICRNTSVVARLGGNYFVIVRQMPVHETIPKISDTILNMLEHIRLKQREVRMIDNHSFRVDIAVGWAAFSEFENEKVTFHNADARMYADKKNRKGQ
jgi:diguanylate cyclase (GGDEF)-like protein/PAS domain S-box-containing protein